ncbi:meckelin-like [Spodoptera litura]|uniref:Meckelin-like n=1 Tax=Spodoptera litura TaxID=69820 RepID=A0A9J7ILI9_SPOLT|nr:meckelin-like [Spodoptera litura]
MVPSADGFGCSCAEHSVPVGIGRCKPCNATEVVSADGYTCVPRRCQNVSGRIACRKCPHDYVTVTQNIDGSPLKEVQCVKCARGFRPINNVCARCESCTCAKNQIIVRGICIPKTYVNSRPKYEENSLHPLALLDVVKHEYLCMQNDLRACQTLANECVKNFYSTDAAGPCRLWIQPKLVTPKALPRLIVESTLEDKNPGETYLGRKRDSILIAAAVFSTDGRFKFIKDTNQDHSTSCRLPVKIRIGRDFYRDCIINVSKLAEDLNETISPYLYAEGKLVQIPVYPRKPNGQPIQKGTWISSKFKRFFIMDGSLSIVTNTTNYVYLRTMEIKLQIERDKASPSSLRVQVSVEVSYASKSPLSESVTTTLKVVHVMPEAGVHRGLEIWGGVLGCLLTLYAMVQWRGVVRRGGLYVSVLPLMAAALADTFYFAAWFSTLHALAAEAGTLGLTLPLSKAEERIIMAFVYTAVSLKAVKVAWINFNQCRCDVFFLDWSEYNPPYKGAATEKYNSWRASTLAREWSRMQTMRRVSPGYTTSLALLVLHLLVPWRYYLPPSQGYKWAVATIAWWSSYITLLSSRWVVDRALGSPTAALAKICSSVGLSLLVFEEEHYAHYIHGRIVYKQLSLSIPALGETETRQSLLSRFLAAFFERALDGLSWVASERTVFERLLNVELNTREAGNTSTLLYDPDESTPSCFAVTWWGEEWSLATFEAMLFGSLMMATNEPLIAALVTLIVWQVMMRLRRGFGNRNQREKTDIQM